MGAAVSLISKTTQENLFPAACLDKSPLILRTYTVEAIPVIRQIEVQVKYGEHTGRHMLHVVRGKGPPLLGRDWLDTSVWTGPVSVFYLPVAVLWWWNS